MWDPQDPDSDLYYVNYTAPTGRCWTTLFYIARYIHPEYLYDIIIGWDKDFQAHGKATRSNSAAVCLLFSPLIMEAHEGVEHAQEKVWEWSPAFIVLVEIINYVCELPQLTSCLFKTLPLTRIMDVRRCGIGNPGRIIDIRISSQIHAYLWYDLLIVFNLNHLIRSSYWTIQNVNILYMFTHCVEITKNPL